MCPDIWTHGRSSFSPPSENELPRPTLERGTHRRGGKLPHLWNHFLSVVLNNQQGSQLNETCAREVRRAFKNCRAIRDKSNLMGRNAEHDLICIFNVAIRLIL